MKSSKIFVVKLMKEFNNFFCNPIPTAPDLPSPEGFFYNMDDRRFYALFFRKALPALIVL
jgi:hypothetical protein